MPATYIHFSEELKKKKEETGKSWEEILVAGVEASFNLVREACKNAHRDTQKPVSHVEGSPGGVEGKDGSKARRGERQE